MLDEVDTVIFGSGTACICIKVLLDTSTVPYLPDVTHCSMFARCWRRVALSVMAGGFAVTFARGEYVLGWLDPGTAYCFSPASATGPEALQRRSRARLPRLGQRRYTAFMPMELSRIIGASGIHVVLGTGIGYTRSASRTRCVILIDADRRGVRRSVVQRHRRRAAFSSAALLACSKAL